MYLAIEKLALTSLMFLSAMVGVAAGSDLQPGMNVIVIHDSTITNGGTVTQISAGTSLRIIRVLDKQLEYALDGSKGVINLKDVMDESSAMKSFSQRITKRPDDAEALRGRAELAWSMNKMDVAEADLKAMLKIDPNDALRHRILGCVLMVQGKPDLAVNEFDKAIALAPGVARAYHHRAQARMMKSGLIFASAIPGGIWYQPRFLNYAVQPLLDPGIVRSIADDYEESLRRDHSDADYYCSRAYLQSAQGKFKEALGDCNAGIRLNRMSEELWAQRCYANYMTGEIEEAARDIDNCLRINPKNLQALLVRGRIYLDSNRLELAEKDFDLAVEIAPMNTEVIGHRAAMRLVGADFSGAADDYSKVIRLNPSIAMAWVDRGMAKAGMNQLDGAIADYDAGIAKFQQAQKGPDDLAQMATAFARRGAAWRLKGVSKKALADYEEAIGLNPKDYFPYHERGILRGIEGDLPAAIDDLTVAQRLAPRNKDVYVDRGRAFRQVGRLDLAVLDFDQAIKLSPKDFSLFVLRGICHSENNQLDKALADLNEGIRLNSKSVMGHTARGDVWEKLGNVERAAGDRQEARRISELKQR